jgi:hypothetical protein
MKIRSLWAVLLWIVFLGVGQALGQTNQEPPQKAKGKDQKEATEKKRPRLPAEIEEVIEDARVAPAEFASDALLRIAESGKVTDRDWRRDLLEEAFRLALGAQHPIRRSYLGGSVDTRTGYLDMAFDLKLDALSLRCRAVKAMLAVDKEKARELFSEIQRPEIPPATCEDTLLYELDDFYDALKDVAQAAFTPDEMRQDEHIHFVASFIGSINSPRQTVPAVKTILALKVSPAQLDSLVHAFSGALKKISGDDRSFNSCSFVLSQNINQLVKVCAQRDVARDELLTAYRDYLIRHHNGNRCSDNAKNKGEMQAPADLIEMWKKERGLEYSDYIEFFNEKLRLENQPSQKVIPPILKEELKPAKIEGAPKYYHYWQTPQAKSLLRGLRELRFGPMEKQLAAQAEKKSVAPLTEAQRETLEWKQRLNEFLQELRDWKVLHEASEADYFHQKCVTFGALIELTPSGPMRENLLLEYMAFLRENHFQRESLIEWYFHARELFPRLSYDKGEDGRAKAIEALSNSGDALLQLQAELEKMFPQAKPAAR